MKNLLLMGLMLVGACSALAIEPVKQVVLAQGTDAATLRGQLGDPARIEKVRGAAGKKERWIYRRQVAVSQQSERYDARGNGIDNARTAVPNFRLVQVTKYEVLTLTLLDGRLESSRRGVEQEEKYLD